MKKFLREDQTMLDSQRQVTGIGDTAKGQMVQTPNAPSTIPSAGKMELKPFQIDASIPKIGDMFVKMMELRAEFEGAKNNPATKDSQKIALEKSIKGIDEINKRLLKIPDYLSVFCS